MKVTYVNDSVAEFVRIPDVTNHQELAIVGYLLFQGPLDGTGLTRFVDHEREDAQTSVEEFKEHEFEREMSRIHEYLRDPPEYIVSQFDRTYDTAVLFHEHTEEYEVVVNGDVRPLYKDSTYNEHIQAKAKSVYRTDDGDWDRHKLHRTATASFQFDEAFEYLGRWAGDDVRLVINPDGDDLDGDDVTQSVAREMTQVLPDQFLVNGDEVLTPDMVITGSDGGGGEDEQEPPELFQ